LITKENTHNHSAELAFSQRKSQGKSNATQIPEISLPKGGGALKGIDEKFEINPSNGTAVFNIPLPISNGRNDLSPNLSLNYNSASGNSPFGLGWSIDLAFIQRRTDKQLPRYDNCKEDVFIFNGGEDLVPALEEDGCCAWNSIEQKTELFTIKRYRPRIDGAFDRIEKIIHADQGTYWRVTTKENITTFYGLNKSSRKTDPNDHSRIFKWLPEISFDNKGNSILYEYKEENLDGIPCLLHEHNRQNGLSLFTNKYLKRIQYGNHKPWFIDPENLYLPEISKNLDFFFELVFDYGEHNVDLPDPQKQEQPWPYRPDAFSDYKAGFELRTNRLCQRVLLFHHFAELGTGPSLVRSLDFKYEPSSINDSGQAEVIYLQAIKESGYIKTENGYAKKSLPAMEFDYQRLKWNTEKKTLSPDSVLNAPVGLTNNYQWVDLYGEGISGILTEQGEGWFYKENLGDQEDNGSVEFTRARNVIPRPSLAGLAKDLTEGSLAVMDLENNGKKQVVVNTPGLQGYFELADGNNWAAFRAFEEMANVNFQDPNTKFLDVTGDGQPDLVMTENQVFVWYAANGKKGFKTAERTTKPFDENIGPAVIFNDLEQKIYLADMTGDGMKDIVRARNGEVCYWANLGYGKFGAKVTMSNAPWFDTPDLFNAEYLQFEDVSGTGATDLIYFGKDHFKAYLNLSGNAWSEVQEIDPFFPINRNTKITVTDLFGNGTSTIVWSSDLPGDRYAPMRYIDLMGGKKPHVLNSYKNNLGKEVTLEYKSSTHFYLKDKQAGTPWKTKLAFPVQVVSKLIIEDKITKARATSAYTYHHGFYDHKEREFRGFGRVEQTDSEQFAEWSKNNKDNQLKNENALYQAPVLTKTWFHTGAFLERENLLNQFQTEYWYAEYERLFPCELDCFEEPQLKDATLVAAPIILDKSIAENCCPEVWREALRSCKGMMLRQEVFALDPKKGDNATLKKQAKPYSVATHNCQIQILQPKEVNQYAVFQVMESEALNMQYERNEKDPRIAHTLNVAIDEFGNILETASVVYPRKIKVETLPELVLNEQQKTRIIFSKNKYTNDVMLPEAYRLRLLAETASYELTAIDQEKSLYQLEDFQNIITNKTNEIGFQETPIPGTPQHRKIGHSKTIYYEEHLKEALAFEKLASHGLPFQTYQLAYTPELLIENFGEKIQDHEALRTEGGYVDLEDDKNWWLPSERMIYCQEGEDLTVVQNRFYSPIAFQDAFGATTKIKYYKDYFLLVEETEDALQNRNRIEEFNFRNLAPQILRDLNDNLHTVLFDELGLVKAFAKLGKDLDEDGTAELDIADNLDGLKATTEANEILLQFFQAENSEVLTQQASALLQNATTRFVYDFGAYQREGKPAVVATIQRETHLGNLPAGKESRLQISFEYSDGLGNVAMQKTQATPGLAKTINEDGELVEVDTNENLRWLGNGRTVLNNKGNPVKQYEPYFSTTPQYEADAQLVEIGVTPILYYDALDRLVKTDFPDGTFSKVEFDGWQQRSFDQNDTVKDSQWYADRINGEDKKEQTAAQRTILHNNTPTAIHLDTLGRPILSIEHNKKADSQDEFYQTITLLDLMGNIEKIIDARENVVMSYEYDLTNQRIYQNSMDSGERWLLHNAAQKPMRRWDGRGHSFEFMYDKLQRPLETKVLGGDGAEALDNIYEKIIYGEGIADDKLFNLRGQVFCQFDTAGLVTHNAYDDGGKILETHRQFAKDYKTIVDWSGENNNEKLESESFCTIYEYDALDRVIAHTTPDGSITKPVYSIANLLEKIAVLKRGVAPSTISKPSEKQAEREGMIGTPIEEETEPEKKMEDKKPPKTGMIGTPISEVEEEPSPTAYPTSNTEPQSSENGAAQIIVRHIEYNEKGQRTKIQYGNGVITSHQYDPNTFRLKTIKTTGNDHVNLQELLYNYDPIGNITCIEDKAIPTQFFNNQKIEGKSEYTYDALYRLIQAEGREHIGQQNFGQNDNWQDLPFLKKYGAGDAMTWRNYTQQYKYDPVGNILQTRHKAEGGNWTRDYQYEQNNNRLQQTQVGQQVYKYPHHAQHGFITAMPHLQRMDWNFRDELQAVARQKLTDGSIPETTYYVYDAKGQRVRKITDNACTQAADATPKNERLYLGTLEIYRVHSGQQKGLERTSLHVTEYFSPESKMPEEETSENNKPLTEEEQKVNPTLGTEDTIANIAKRTESGLISSVFHPSLVMGKRIALIDTRNEVDDGTEQETIRFQLSNHLDSVALELDGHGQVISYEEYHPYGTTAYQAIDTAIKAVAKRYRYTGKERDEESGLYYHGARYYLPWLGRWLKPDPGGMVDGSNLFFYNPIISIDFTGFNKSHHVQIEEIKSLKEKGKEAEFQERLRKFPFGKYLEKTLKVEKPKEGTGEGEMERPHAHHIVQKKGGGEFAEKSRELLLENGIDPFFGKENLVFAPNKFGNHSNSTAKKIFKTLKSAADTGGREAIVKALKKLGAAAAKGKFRKK